MEYFENIDVLHLNNNFKNNNILLSSRSPYVYSRKEKCNTNDSTSNI